MIKSTTNREKITSTELQLVLKLNGAEICESLCLGDKATGIRSPEQRQYGLSIDTRGINSLSTRDDRQSRLIKLMQAFSLLWERAVMPD